MAYPWSSHAENIGARAADMVTSHVEYAALASTPESRHAAYRGLFALPQDPEFVAAIREATHGGYPLIGEELKGRLVAEGRKHIERGKPGPPSEESPEPDCITGELAFGEK